jgi:hypothetical protein
MEGKRIFLIQFAGFLGGGVSGGVGVGVGARIRFSSMSRSHFGEHVLVSKMSG